MATDDHELRLGEKRMIQATWNVDRLKLLTVREGNIEAYKELGGLMLDVMLGDEIPEEIVDVLAQGGLTIPELVDPRKVN